jgi:hypothetical protein
MVVVGVLCSRFTISLETPKPLSFLASQFTRDIAEAASIESLDTLSSLFLLFSPPSFNDDNFSDCGSRLVFESFKALSKRRIMEKSIMSKAPNLLAQTTWIIGEKLLTSRSRDFEYSRLTCFNIDAVLDIPPTLHPPSHCMP